MAIKHAKRKVAPKKDAAATSDIVVAGNYKARQHVVENMEYWNENYILKDVNRFPTTEHFWDCECETNYIHPKCVTVCPRCGAVSDECSDSRINEVFAALMASPDISNW